MIKVYAPPKEIKKPKFINSGNSTHDWKKYQVETEKYFKEIKDFCSEQGSGKYKGEDVRFPVADGQAIYVVYSCTPMELIHCDMYDGYDYPYIERLTKKDIINAIEMARNLEKIFKRK